MANQENLIPAKPGEVRNPNGRPKGSRNRATIAREMLTIVGTIPQSATNLRQAFEAMGFTTSDEMEVLITASHIIKAISGDTTAYNAVMNSAYGAPKQEVETDKSTTILVRREKKSLLTGRS